MAYREFKRTPQMFEGRPKLSQTARPEARRKESVASIQKNLRTDASKAVPRASASVAPSAGAAIWVWVKMKPPADRRFWSMFPLTRVLLWVHSFDPESYMAEQLSIFLQGLSSSFASRGIFQAPCPSASQESRNSNSQIKNYKV